MWCSHDSLVHTHACKAPTRSASHVLVFSFSSKLWRGPLWRGLQVWQRRTPLRGSRRGPQQVRPRAPARVARGGVHRSGCMNDDVLSFSFYFESNLFVLIG